MLKYLIVQLDDTSPSFCHYSNGRTERRLIDLDTLRHALVWAMKENLMIQFVYPDYELPKEYLDLIDSVDHVDIEKDNPDADVSILDGREDLTRLKDRSYPHVVLRLSKKELLEAADDIADLLGRQPSLNIVITDIESFRNEDFEAYASLLEKWGRIVMKKMEAGAPVSLNLLTDRLILSQMNNCNAGHESITLAPDGRFYICPAFYLDGEESVGNPAAGVAIPNSRLYKLSHAPICRVCDAYQCKRCVWLNQKTTLDVNTPSREQCVVAHLERNASRALLEQAKKAGMMKAQESIPEIDYLDPFDKIKR